VQTRGKLRLQTTLILLFFIFLGFVVCALFVSWKYAIYHADRNATFLSGRYNIMLVILLEIVSPIYTE